MRINLTGSYTVVLQTMRSMREIGIPFIFHNRLVYSYGSRKIISTWESVYDPVYDSRETPKHSYSILVRDRDLDLIILLSTAVVTHDYLPWGNGFRDL